VNVLNESCHLRKTLLRINGEATRKLYYYIQWTGHFICKSDFFIKRSDFESLLLLYTVTGSGTLTYHGSSYRLTENTVAVIDCRLPHEYRPEADGWEFRYLHTNGAQAMELCQRAENTCTSPVILCGRDTLRFFERIYTAADTKASDEACSELIYRLLMRLIEASGSEANRGEPSWLQAAYDEVADKYGKGLTVTELSRAVNMSRSHFSVEFKRQTGVTPWNYLSAYRLSAAKDMLYGTNKTVEDIAAECGYRDASVFIRAFKRAEGVTPSAYRKTGVVKPKKDRAL
jgi:AraC-like DNA-binding protein